MQVNVYIQMAIGKRWYSFGIGGILSNSKTNAMLAWAFHGFRWQARTTRARIRWCAGARPQTMSGRAALRHEECKGQRSDDNLVVTFWKAQEYHLVVNWVVNWMIPVSHWVCKDIFKSRILTEPMPGASPTGDWRAAWRPLPSRGAWWCLRSGRRVATEEPDLWKCEKMVVLMGFKWGLANHN